MSPRLGTWQLVMLVVAVVGVLALLGFARGEPGDGGRSPDAQHARSAGG